ncbi:MAG TPA: carboxymuconolactone decarboxylase family protein [Roseiarcus sp.]|nr:carboxymuconolactone decarboxylase family protein [Roseiarcus sp.]
MSIFEVQTIDGAPEASRAPLEKLERTFGMVPNVAGVIANSPVLTSLFVLLFEGVHRGTFTEAEIQTLLLTNAVTNACAWAVAFHSCLALKAGLDPGDVQAIRDRRAPRGPRYAALSTYARALIEQRGRVGDAAITALLSAGFKPDQALEVLAVSAASTITNYALNIAEPLLEPMFQEHAWRPDSAALATVDEARTR